FHQAMIEVPTDDSPPGTVVQVMQPGYVLNGRLIRPALVGVAKGSVPKKVDTTA
ncbi:MAG: nucleotide exchange factor GrpE, partial [Pseudomonadota bacterium]